MNRVSLLAGYSASIFSIAYFVIFSRFGESGITQPSWLHVVTEWCMMLGAFSGVVCVVSAGFGWFRRRNPISYYTKKEDREKAISLLKAVLANQLSAETALSEWPVSTTHGTTDTEAMANAYHQMHHYFADEDTRAREPEYAKYQQGIMQECLNDLLAEAATLE
jgi:hypothetical protein